MVVRLTTKGILIYPIFLKFIINTTNYCPLGLFSIPFKIRRSLRHGKAIGKGVKRFVYYPNDPVLKIEKSVFPLFALVRN